MSKTALKRIISKSKVDDKRKYSVKLLKVLWWTAFLNFMIFPLFVIFGDLFPGQAWLQIRPIIINDMNLSYLLAMLYVITGFIIIIGRPQTQKRILVITSIGAVATALFSLLTMNENVILNSFTWFVVLFCAQILFGWKWFAIGSAAILITGILKNVLCYDVGDFSTSLQYAFISGTTVIVYAGLMSILRTTGTIKIEVFEQLKTREEIQAANLLTVVNSINDAILNVGMRGKILMHNATSLSLFDTNIDLNGIDVDSFLNLTTEHGDPVKFKDLIKGVDGVTVVYTDLIHTYPDGQKINLYVAISPVHRAFGRDDTARSASGVIMIMRDITRQKALDDERDEFISVVSHELRTPVAVVEGAVSNLQFLLEKGDDPKLLSQSLEDAHQQVALLSSMLNDISTLSRAQRGVYMDPENINVGEFVEGLCKKYLPEANKLKLKLEKSVAVDGNIYIARMLIEEVMQNLISNALRYTHEGKIIIGTRLPEPDDDKHIEFYIKDSGIGISQADQKHIFQKFWRSEDYRTRETNGTGLGLHVVRQLADKMNTKVEFVSRLNYGSTFSFKLPLSQPETKTESTKKDA